MVKSRIYFIPNPDKILIKITKRQLENITSKMITRDDGKKIRLFTEPEFEKGFDRRYQQNVSTGVILAVGENVKGIYASDLAIIDYLVSNNDDVLIGFLNGDQLCAIDARTVYHTTDSKPDSKGRRAFVKGDFEVISPLLGVVRRDKIIAFSPYVFLVPRSEKIVSVLPNGRIKETDEQMSEREVLAGSETSKYKDGDIIITPTLNIFNRHIEGQEISVVFEKDILCKK